MCTGCIDFSRCFVIHDKHFTLLQVKHYCVNSTNLCTLYILHVIVDSTKYASNTYCAIIVVRYLLVVFVKHCQLQIFCERFASVGLTPAHPN